jgi:hypothetical protein
VNNKERNKDLKKGRKKMSPGHHHVSFMGYAVGLALVLACIVFPLAAMGLRSRSVFRRLPSMT